MKINKARKKIEEDTIARIPKEARSGEVTPGQGPEVSE